MDGFHEDEGVALDALLRHNIGQFRTMLARNPDEPERRRILRLLAEAEAALAEIETPEAG